MKSITKTDTHQKQLRTLGQESRSYIKKATAHMTAQTPLQIPRALTPRALLTPSGDRVLTYPYSRYQCTQTTHFSHFYFLDCKVPPLPPLPNSVLCQPSETRRLLSCHERDQRGWSNTTEVYAKPAHVTSQTIY